MNPPSALLFRSPALAALAMFTFGMAAPLQAKDKDDKDPMLRIVCATAIAGQDEYILASQKKNGRWKEHQTLELRNSLITPWLEATEKELFLCVEKDRDLISKCTITFPKGANRILVILLPGENEGEYKAQVIDTAKHKFGKGEILVVNSSSMLGEVSLGENKVEVQPGEVSVHKPTLDEQGMFHRLVTYTDESEEVITCSDSFVPGNDAGRDFLILSSDPRMGIRVSTLTDFGPFE